MGQPFSLLPGLAGIDSTGALCEIGRQLASRLDALIGLLGRSHAQITSIVSDNDSGIGDLAALLKLSLASAPLTHDRIQVSTSPERIISNASERTVAFTITNNDGSQKVIWGTETLSSVNSNGIYLDAESSVKIYVPRDTDVYAFFPIATSSVSVSKLSIP